VSNPKKNGTVLLSTAEELTSAQGQDTNVQAASGSSQTVPEGEIEGEKSGELDRNSEDEDEDGADENGKDNHDDSD
jgi:hypothetical protein